MKLLLAIAVKHLLARRRQSLVSVLGIVLGVAFFLAISGLMQGSEQDFIRRLVDNTPHITISDEYRAPRPQAAEALYGDAALLIHGVQPLTETRGIRGYEQILSYLRRTPDLLASPVLTSQAVVTYAGRDRGITLYGMIPSEINSVSTIQDYMLEGSVEQLIANPNGIIIGQELLKRLSTRVGDNLNIASSIGEVRSFKILGVFRTGRADFDERQTFVHIKRAQALFNRAHRVNTIIVKLPDPQQAQKFAADIEGQFHYKAVSWQESSEDLMNTLTIRNIIMYTVVSAVLIVAAFGIFNVISTIVMEKNRDIAILKSMGFYAQDIEHIFLFQGILLGLLGILLGLPLGMVFMRMLMLIEFTPPGGTQLVSMPVSWHWMQFLIASGFAFVASISAAYLPSRKAARVEPVYILRGGQ